MPGATQAVLPPFFGGYTSIFQRFTRQVSDRIWNTVTFTVDNLRALLAELNDAMTIEDAGPAEWLVCGGTALALQGFGSRTTRDVDVLGNWLPQGLEVVAIGTFPAAIERSIARVAAAHPELQGMGSAWVNLGAQPLVGFGLPEGFAQRLTAVRVGERLTLHLLGRTDLIALKLFAAADDIGSRQQIHLDDLRSFRPTEEEIENAIRWTVRMPAPHHRIKPTLKDIVEELGFHELAYYL
ncbi:MAG: hypothetical protein JNM94_15090 [Phycisphaerae bacterium]|nr:hypothetical protein [Phycisphaerae bacterium]